MNLRTLRTVLIASLGLLLCTRGVGAEQAQATAAASVAQKAADGIKAGGVHAVD